MRQAVRDLSAAERTGVVSDPLLDVAAFHAQQSVEKTLKAFLTMHRQVFAKTHDLDLLLRQCISINPNFAQFLPAATVEAQDGADLRSLHVSHVQGVDEIEVRVEA